MQYQFFSIPALYAEKSPTVEEMNAFLRSHRILTVKRELIAAAIDSFWSICIEYVENSDPGNIGKNGYSKPKVDYRTILSEEAFALFRILRECRKQIAEEEAIPPFAIFLDEHLAEMTKLQELTEKSLLSVPGVGEKKVEKYGKHFLELLEQKKDEAGR